MKPAGRMAAARSSREPRRGDARPEHPVRGSPDVDLRDPSPWHWRDGRSAARHEYCRRACARHGALRAHQRGDGVRLNSIGAWAPSDVNPKDDPRKKTR
jgi:hypothetical protein